MSRHAAQPLTAVRWLTAATAGLGTAACVALYAASIAPAVSQAAEPAPEPPQATTEATTGIAPIFTTPPPPAAQPWSEDDGPIYVADPTPRATADVADRTTAPKPARVVDIDPQDPPSAPAGRPPLGPDAPTSPVPDPAPVPPADVAGDPPAARPAQPDTVGVTELVNTARADAGCQPVTDDPTLTSFAQQWAEQQAADRLMRHSDGPYAENVAMGYATAAEVFDGWVGSSGHRSNILECSWTRTGVGSAVGDDGLTYWTQVFEA